MDYNAALQKNCEMRLENGEIYRLNPNYGKERYDYLAERKPEFILWLTAKDKLTEYFVLLDEFCCELEKDVITWLKSETGAETEPDPAIDILEWLNWDEKIKNIKRQAKRLVQSWYIYN